MHKCIWLMRLTPQGFTIICSQNTKPFIPSWYLVSKNTENINIIENECMETEAQTKYFKFEWMFNWSVELNEKLLIELIFFW